MSNALNTLFSNIAAAIRTKNGSSNTYYPNQMANAILAIPTGGSTINNQDKTVTPTNSQQLVSYDSGYTGLGTVTVNAMPSGTVTAPSSISGTAATVSTGTNTLTLTKTISVTPSVTTAGYVSAGTAGNSSVSLTASIPINDSGDITESGGVFTIPAGYYVEDANCWVDTAAFGTATGSVNANGRVSIVIPVSTAGYVSGQILKDYQLPTTKAAATITPGTSNQTIAAGTYLTGAQTISGDANLVGSNILSNVSIFGVSGTVDFITCYSGSSAPSSSTGSNGDIYLQS